MDRNGAKDAALATLPEAVMVVDPSGRLVYANPAGEALLGSVLPSEGPVGWEGCFRGALPFARALEGTEPGPATVVHLATGRSLLVCTHPLRTAAGEVRGVMFLFRASTLALELQAAERQRTAILDNIPDLAWLKDRSGRFLAVNRHWLEFYGLSRAEDVLGTTDFDHSPPELAEHYVADDAEVVRTGSRRVVEELTCGKDGVAHWIETIKTPVFGASGEVVGTAGIARDIELRKRYEASLQSLNEELTRRVEARTRELAQAHEALVRRERLAVLGQLAGGVAHQIRNPLSAILNAAALLKAPGAGRALGPDGDIAVAIIQEEALQANAVITGLLDFARVHAPARRPTALEDVVQRVLAQERLPPEVTVELALEPGPPLLLDAGQLLGAVSVLVRNALEALDGRGTLRVELKREGGGATLAVVDTGPGLAPHIRQHLFEPLQSTKPMGIGLGLVTARTLVEANGGQLVWVEQAKGTRFEIRLPG